MTKLEAINIMLSVIGESPLTDIKDGYGNEDATLAIQILNETNNAVQTLGWAFNSEANVILSPDYSKHQIFIPRNTARITPANKDVVQRDGRLYDKFNHTYDFSVPQVVEIIYLLDYEKIPHSAQYYIALKSSRIFQSRCLSSTDLLKEVSFEEMDALQTLKRDDIQGGKYNVLKDNPAITRILRRH